MTTFTRVRQAGLVHVGSRYGIPCCATVMEEMLGPDLFPARDDEPITCFECLSLPWLNEPEGDEFTCAGYRCVIKRGGTGGWCGYVDVPRGHPMAREGRAEQELDVHGGVTFTGIGGDVDGDNHTFRIGFDCGHFGDWAPDMPGSRRDGVYRGIEYVRAEVRRLAVQLQAAARLEP